MLLAFISHPIFEFAVICFLLLTGSFFVALLFAFPCQIWMLKVTTIQKENSLQKLIRCLLKKTGYYPSVSTYQSYSKLVVIWTIVNRSHPWPYKIWNGEKLIHCVLSLFVYLLFMFPFFPDERLHRERWWELQFVDQLQPIVSLLLLNFAFLLPPWH